MLQSLPESILLDTTTASLCLELPGSHLCAAVHCSTGWSLLLLLVLALSRMHLSVPHCCKLLLQGPAAGPGGASMGWELRWHLAEAQAVSTAWKDAAMDLYLLQGETHGLAFIVQRRDRRDMYSNRSRVTALSFPFSTRCSQR